MGWERDAVLMAGGFWGAQRRGSFWALSPRIATALPIRSGRAVIYIQLPVPGPGGRRGCVGVTGFWRDLATPGIAHAAAATAASSTEAGWGGHGALMARAGAARGHCWLRSH